MLRDLFRLFPAHAGVIPYITNDYGKIDAFPRTCGGDPCGSSSTINVRAFSPHMRG